MKKALLAEAGPNRQLIFSVLLIIGAWMIFQLFGIITGMFLFKLGFNEVAGSLNSLNDPDMIAFLKYVQSWTSAGMFIAAPVTAAWIISYDWKGYLGLRVFPDWRVVTFSILFIIAILPFNNLLTYINSQLQLPSYLGGIEEYFRDKETLMSGIMESFLKPASRGGIIVNIIVIALIPGIGEEIAFRGLMQKILLRWFKRPHLPILITAIIFSAVHFQFYSFLPRLFLGLVLGYLFLWSSSIWLVIIVHILNNSAAVMFYALYYQGSISDKLEKAGAPGEGSYLAILGLMAGAGLLYSVYYFYRNKRVKLKPEG